MSLASIAFRTGPEPMPVVIWHADDDVGGVDVRALGGRSDSVVARPRCPCLIPRAGCTGGMFVIVAAVP